MLTSAQSLVLGVVQGLTEFLPISSSGHLILARDILGVNTESGLAFDAVLQLGSILAVFIYFRREVWRLVITAFGLLGKNRKFVKTEDRNLVYGIILGTIPALIFGLLLQDAMDSIFRNAFTVACSLIAGSILFYSAERLAKQKSAHPSVKQGWWIGVFQCLALVPGMSRSGSTISGGLLLGLTRESATRFGFLLSLPIITGSGLLMFVKIIKHGATDFTYSGLALGFAASFIVGYACIAWLVGYLKKHSLILFVWYRLALATAVLTIFAMNR
ncbi:MAG: undecaprenyl-diphosphatase UppP [Patescibacteria group bacterium]